MKKTFEIGTLLSTCLAMILAFFGIISWWIPLLVFLTGIKYKA